MAFQLQILHASDQEAGIPAFQDAVGLSAVMNALQDDYVNTLKLTSGDTFIAGPFFGASSDIYNDTSNGKTAGQPGLADILIQNELGWAAASIGNHEFDQGDETFLKLLPANANFVNGTTGKGIGPGGYPGALFPYLANNLDFSAATIPSGLTILPNAQAPQANSITGSVIVNVNGQQVGVLSVVTPYLKSIANIGKVVVTTGTNITGTTPIAEQVAALITNLQPAVQQLVNAGVNKIVLMTHLQESEIEEALAQALVNQGIPVDVIIGGGSHRVMANEDDPLRGDETQQTNGQLLEPYPKTFTAGNNSIYYVNTGSNYRYLSRLVVTFDDNGIITEIGNDSGTYATDIAGVDRLYEADITTLDQVKSVADPELVAIIEGVQTYVNQLDANIFGQTSVFLNGIRGSVRIQETNLGNLAADAQDFYAEQYLATYGNALLPGFNTIDISFKNGGGIRDQIGQSFVPGGGGDLVQLPPAGNPDVGKEDGDVSQLDIFNSLRFNNTLTVGTLTASDLKEIFEHAVARAGTAAGQFAQVSGIRYSFDPNRPARTGPQTGQRIRNLVVLNNDGSVKDVVVQNGQLVGDPNRQFSVVTLSFLATGGDSYPTLIQNQQKLGDFAEPLTLGKANLPSGGEQDALAEYLAAFFNKANGQAPFSDLDTPQGGDLRIQDLTFRKDTVLAGTGNAGIFTIDQLVKHLELARGITPSFDEELYLLTNPDVAQAVANGQISSGLEHFNRFGQAEGRGLLPLGLEVGGIRISALYDETYYLAQNPDVLAAVAQGSLSSGFEHFLTSGWLEGRDPSNFYDEKLYLSLNADVKAAVQAGIFSSGLQHYLLNGHIENRTASILFDPNDYLLSNPDVKAAVDAGVFQSGFDHMLEAGADEGRVNALLFEESTYLAQNQDVANAVAAGQVASGFDHFAAIGQREGRTAGSLFSEAAYLGANPDVAGAVTGGAFVSGFEHFVLAGRAEVRLLG